MSGYFSNAILTDIAYLPGSTGIVSKIFTPRGSIWRWKARESATNAREHAPLSFGEFAVRRTTKKPCLKYAEEELPCISKPNLYVNYSSLYVVLYFPFLFLFFFAFSFFNKT